MSTMSSFLACLRAFRLSRVHPQRTWGKLAALTLTSIVLWAIPGILMPVPAHADAGTAVNGWCTPVGGGEEEWFGEPVSACQRQNEIYGNHFLGIKDHERW